MTGGEDTAGLEDFRARLQQQICEAFDLQPWEIGIGKAPWHVRLLAPFRWSWWWWRIRRTWYRLTYREDAGDE